MLIYAFIPIFSLDPPASRLIFSPGNNSSCSVHSVSCPDSKLLKDLQFNIYSFIFIVLTSLQLPSILHSKKKRLKTNSKSYRAFIINSKQKSQLSHTSIKGTSSAPNERIQYQRERKAPFSDRSNHLFRPADFISLLPSVLLF